jgi:hypothetical protein
MKGDYPQFQKSYSHEELIEHFMLDETEREFIAQFRADKGRFFHVLTPETLCL